MIPLTTARGTVARPHPLLEALAGAALALWFFPVLLLKEPEIHRGLLATVYLALLLLMALHDVRTLRVPNRIVYPALGFGVAGSLILGWSDASEALLGGAVAFLVFLAIALVGRGAMGFADVKVSSLCGIVVGVHGLLPMLAITFLSGALVAGILLALRIRKPKDAFPFTPFLVAATAFSIYYFDLYLLS